MTACLFPSYTSHYSIHPGSGSRQPAYFHHTLLTTAFILAVDHDSLPISIIQFSLQLFILAVDQDRLPISIIQFSLQHSSWQWITTACLFPSYTSHYSIHPGSGSRQPAYFHHTLLTTAFILAVDQDSLPISIMCSSHYSSHPGSGSRKPAYFHHTVLTTAFLAKYLKNKC